MHCPAPTILDTPHPLPPLVGCLPFTYRVPENIISENKKVFISGHFIGCIVFCCRNSDKQASKHIVQWDAEKNCCRRTANGNSWFFLAQHLSQCHRTGPSPATELLMGQQFKAHFVIVLILYWVIMFAGNNGWKLSKPSSLSLGETILANACLYQVNFRNTKLKKEKELDWVLASSKFYSLSPQETGFAWNYEASP